MNIAIIFMANWLVYAKNKTGPANIPGPVY